MDLDGSKSSDQDEDDALRNNEVSVSDDEDALNSNVMRPLARTY